MSEKYVVELFSGTGRMSDAFRRHGFDAVSVDNAKEHNPDILIDLNMWDPSELLHKKGRPFAVWASPPCTTFSVASIGRHWKDKKPSVEALEAIDLISAMFRIIGQLRPEYWFIENPRGMLRKIAPFDVLPRKTVTFCQYGETRQKPTERQVSIARRQVFTSTRPMREDMEFRVLIGAIAEVMVKDTLGIKTDKLPGPDPGYDFVANSKFFDVKTRLSKVSIRPTYHHPVYKDQISGWCDAFVFINYVRSSGSYEFCGWIEKSLFLEKSEYVDEGHTILRGDGSQFKVYGNGLYRIRQSELRPFYELVLFKTLGRLPHSSDWKPSPPRVHNLQDDPEPFDQTF